MNRSLVRYSLVIIGIAVWVACYRMSTAHTLLWIAVTWFAAGLCEATMHFRPFWPRYVKFYMGAFAMLLFFAIFQGLRLPEAGVLLHGAWFPALCAAIAAALSPTLPAGDTA